METLQKRVTSLPVTLKNFFLYPEASGLIMLFVLLGITAFFAEELF